MLAKSLQPAKPHDHFHLQKMSWYKLTWHKRYPQGHDILKSFVHMYLVTTWLHVQITTLYEDIYENSTLSSVFGRCTALGLNDIPPHSRRNWGFLIYPHPPFALKKPCTNQRGLPYPWTTLQWKHLWRIAGLVQYSKFCGGLFNLNWERIFPNGSLQSYL